MYLEIKCLVLAWKRLLFPNTFQPEKKGPSSSCWHVLLWLLLKMVWLSATQLAVSTGSQELLWGNGDGVRGSTFRNLRLHGRKQWVSGFRTTSALCLVHLQVEESWLWKVSSLTAVCLPLRPRMTPRKGFLCRAIRSPHQHRLEGWGHSLRSSPGPPQRAGAVRDADFAPRVSAKRTSIKNRCISRAPLRPSRLGSGPAKPAVVSQLAQFLPTQHLWRPSDYSRGTRGGKGSPALPAPGRRPRGLRAPVPAEALTECLVCTSALLGARIPAPGGDVLNKPGAFYDCRAHTWSRSPAGAACWNSRLLLLPLWVPAQGAEGWCWPHPASTAQLAPPIQHWFPKDSNNNNPRNARLRTPQERVVSGEVLEFFVKGCLWLSNAHLKMKGPYSLLKSFHTESPDSLEIMCSGYLPCLPDYRTTSFP